VNVERQAQAWEHKAPREQPVHKACKDWREHRESQGHKEGQAHRALLVHKESAVCKEHRESQGHKERQAHRALLAHKVRTVHKAHKEQREYTEQRVHRAASALKVRQELATRERQVHKVRAVQLVLAPLLCKAPFSRRQAPSTGRYQSASRKWSFKYGAAAERMLAFPVL